MARDYPEISRLPGVHEILEVRMPVMSPSHWIDEGYNPYLIGKYKAHINVEVCASIGVVKYLNKYIYKGPDRTCLQVQRNPDESYCCGCVRLLQNHISTIGLQGSSAGLCAGRASLRLGVAITDWL